MRVKYFDVVHGPDSMRPFLNQNFIVIQVAERFIIDKIHMTRNQVLKRQFIQRIFI